jgi:microcystin-dependent protein
MANYEATRYNFDGANLQDIEGVNTGIIIPWSTTSVPTGFLECNGAAVSRTTYAALFAVVGTTWGAGDGSTTFNLPDLTDSCCQNESPTKAFASTGGANTVAVTGNIAGSTGNTTIDVPTLAAHSHPDASRFMSGITFSGGTAAGPVGAGSGSTGGSGGHSHPFSGTFAGDSKSVLQPYLTIMYIIKT